MPARPTKLLASFIIASVIAVGSLGTALAGSDADLRAKLLSRYADMKAAMAAHDGAAVAAILTSDFESVDISGHSETGSQMIQEVSALKPDPNKWSETSLLSIAPGTGPVVVQQQYHMKTIKIADDGSTHHVELITLSTDTWVKTGGVWHIERTITDEISYFRDGQLVMHKTKAS